jgi:hypothetical protein
MQWSTAGLTEFICRNPFLAVRRPQQANEVPLEIVAEAIDVLLRIFPNHL